MGRFFISYRRIELSHAGRLKDQLVTYSGPDQVFFDLEALRAGENYPAQLEEELARCDAMVVIIGPAWLDARDDSGTPRLFKDDDWVRREVGRALSRGIPVIPVLVDEAPLPDRAHLPEDMQLLVTNEKLKLGNDPHYLADVARLVDVLKIYLGRVEGKPQPPDLELSPVAERSEHLSVSTAGVFGFVWLDNYLVVKTPVSKELRLAVGDRPRREIYLYDVPVGQRFRLGRAWVDTGKTLPIQVHRPSTKPFRTLHIFLEDPTDFSGYKREVLKPGSGLDQLHLADSVKQKLIP